MRKPQWALQLILVSFSIIFSNLVSAYGGGGTPRPPCKPAKFKRFKPPASSVVEPTSGFSFSASPNTSPSTIKVSVKRIKVKVDVEKQIDGQFRVNGTLPDSLSETWAKIEIVGETHNCKGSASWLIRIAETKQPEVETENTQLELIEKQEESKEGSVQP